MRILLGVSGSIAAYKAIELVRLLTKAGHTVQVALTEGARRFVTPLTFEALTGRPVIVDLFALGGGRIEHVEHAHEVELMVVAPASANTIARLAHGMADDALSAIALSSRAPLVIAPAMETGMWLHPATQGNIALLIQRGARVIGPGSGDLASGRSGVGRMVEVERVFEEVQASLQTPAWVGRHVVITAGPTIERLDPVRYLSNRSTGEMGIAIAAAALRRGARVSLVLGPTHLSPPPGLSVTRVESAREMLEATAGSIAGADVLIATAAVSDFRPAEAHEAKLKRGDTRAHALALSENPDILATLAASPDRPHVVVGFAAETEDVEANARGKLQKKGCDVVIGNRVGVTEGFGPGDTSVVAVFASARPSASFGPAPKRVVAEFVLDQVEAVLGEPIR